MRPVQRQMAAGCVLLLGLIYQVTAESVTLVWDPNSEPDLAGYRFYYGGESGNYTNIVDIKNATTNSVSGLVEGGTYFFAVTAYNTLGLESDFSNEVRYDVP